MGRCNMCGLHESSDKQVIPRGSETPLIYFVSDVPTPAEDREGVSLVGETGNYINTILNELGVFDRARFFNIVRCLPAKCDNGKIQPPSDEEIAICEHYLIEDINKTKPKVVITLGATAAKYMLGEEFTTISSVRGRVYNIDKDDSHYKYIPTYHPAYLLRKSGNLNLASEFKKDIEKALEFALYSGFSFSIDFNDKKPSKSLNYIDFENFYNEHLKQEGKLAFDIETNSLEPFSYDSKIIGFSLSKENMGIYVCFKSLDYCMQDDDKKKCENLLLSILKDKHLIVHNSIFERSFVLSEYGYEIPLEKLDDTLMSARLMEGGHTSASLKNQCVNNFKYPNWDADLGLYRGAVTTIIEKLKLARNKEYRELLFTRGYSDLCEAILEGRFVKQKDDASKNFEMKKYVLNLQDVIEKYYPDELDKILSLVGSFIKTSIEANVNNVSFDNVPERILSTYGAIDSIATFDLYLYYNKKMSRESNEKVDLFKGYHIYLEHAFLGYLFEKNGMYWDDDYVVKDEVKLTNMAIRSLKSLILSPVMKDILVDDKFYDYLPDLLISDYNSYLGSQGLSVVQDTFKGNLVLKVYDIFEGKKYHIKHLKDKFTVPEEIREEIRDKIYDKIIVDVKGYNSINELKSFYNPGASTKIARDILKACLVDEDYIYAAFANNVRDLLGDPKFVRKDPPKTSFDKHIVKLVTLMFEALKEDDDKKADYNLAKTYFEKFKLHVDNLETVRNKLLGTAYGKAHNYEFASADDSSIIEAFNMYRLMGVDPDNKETWNNRFKWLVDFRTFKKVYKLITTYIYGKVGRASVKVVNKVDFEKDLVLRKRSYTTDIKENESYLLDTSFGVNTAYTGRWRSAIHVLPSGNVKKYFTSRFKGGTILQPDYSQMEIRVLAYVAKEETMLAAFGRGEDIHKFNAQQIYNKQDVSESERKFAKGATFSLLYGATVKAFAEEYCDGNLAKANKIFKLFFKSFPTVKDYIDNAHAELEATGRVSLFTNRFVTIPRSNDRDKMKRQAQNFGIQGSASDVVGSAYFEICQYLIDKEYKSKPILFIHDSDELDVYPFELIDVIKNMKTMVNDIPLEKFGVPCYADIVLGKSLGHEIVVREFNCNNSLDICSMELEGLRIDIEETVDNWKKVYSSVDVYEEKWKNKYISISENFQPKRPYNVNAGLTLDKGSVCVKIVY